jgi:ubiquinol oxidase
MSMPTEGAVDLTRHHIPENLSDRFALIFVKFLRFFADIFFAKRYGHRAIVLETVAAVPGMVAGALQHLRALRRMEDDQGWIRILLDEAENERMHLMTFIHIAKPSGLERILVLFTQGVFYNFFFVLYLITPKTAHRIVGYFEEEAIVSYTEYLKEIDSGLHENVPAPRIAIEYWDLAPDARLRDVVKVIRDDEAGHRNVNHEFANSFSRGSRAVVG